MHSKCSVCVANNMYHDLIRVLMGSTDVVNIEFLLPYSKIFLYIWLCIDLFLYAQFISYAQYSSLYMYVNPIVEKNWLIRLCLKNWFARSQEKFEKKMKRTKQLNTLGNKKLSRNGSTESKDTSPTGSRKVRRKPELTTPSIGTNSNNVR